MAWFLVSGKTYAEGLEVVHGDLVAVEVEEGILEHAAVTVADELLECNSKLKLMGTLDSREDKSIAVQPLGVLRVKVHELLEKNVGNRSHAPMDVVSKFVRST